MIPAAHDPVTKVEQRDSLRRLIADVQRLPEQQRSALLMREMGGMAYADVAGALGVSVPAVKSLLVRARLGLAQANEARDTACAEIREDLIASHDRGVRASGLARRHMRDCASCRAVPHRGPRREPPVCGADPDAGADRRGRQPAGLGQRRRRGGGQRRRRQRGTAARRLRSGGLGGRACRRRPATS